MNLDKFLKKYDSSFKLNFRQQFLNNVYQIPEKICFDKYIFFFYFLLAFIYLSSYFLLWLSPQVHLLKEPIDLVIEIASFVFAILSFAWASIRFTKAIRFCENKSSTFYAFFAIAAICVLHCFVVWWNWHSFPLWGDEIYQAVDSIMKFPAQSSAGQHQQPLGYAATAFWVKILPYGPFAIRFTSAFFGFLSCLTLFITLWKLSRSYLISIICAIAYTTSYINIRFSNEGRPQALSLLTGFLFLYVCSELFFDKNNSKKIPISKIINGFFATTFFLLSIGAQPVVYVALYFLLCILLKPTVIKNNFIRIVVVPAGLVMVLFNIQSSRLRAPPRIIVSSLSGVIETISSSFKNEHFQIFFNRFPWSILLCLLALVSFIWDFKKKKAETFDYKWLLFFHWLLFPIIFVASFSYFINYEFHERYFVILNVSQWVTMGCFLAYIFEKLNSSFFKMIFLSVLVMAFAICNFFEKDLKTDEEVTFRGDPIPIYENLNRVLSGPKEWGLVLRLRDRWDEGIYDDFETILGPKSFSLINDPYSLIGKVITGDRPTKLVFVFTNFMNDEEKNELIEGFSRISSVKKIGESYRALYYEYQIQSEFSIDPKLIEFVGRKYLTTQLSGSYKPVALSVVNDILRKDNETAKKKLLQMKAEATHPFVFIGIDTLIDNLNTPL